MATCGGGGGFDVEFVESLPSNFECPICLLALREPNILSCCGIKVCYSCIDQIRQGQKGCPVCREAEFSTMLEKQLCRLVLDLKVYCHHKEKGCEWIGELRGLDKHLDTGDGDTTLSCKYVQVICQYGCGKHLARCEIEMHELKECSKRPLETQVYQMQEMVELIKKEHDSEIKEMKSMIDNQNDIIALLKTRVDALEKQSASNTGSLSPPLAPPSPPPLAPPPPPLAPPLPPPLAPPLPPPLAPPLPPPLAPPLPPSNASVPAWSQAVSSLPPPPLPSLASCVQRLPAAPRLLPPSFNETTFNFQGNRKITIVKDDICLQNTDVIVTSASPSMRHTSGVTLALNRASYGALQRNSNRLLLHSGDLTCGDVVSVEAGGNLICSHVVYAIPPHSMPSSISIPNEYAPLISKSLDKVNSLNAKSVAFAAIGMYGREKRADGVASAMLKAIVSYDYSASKLTDIRIVLINSNIYKVFVDVLKAKRFLETNPTTTTRGFDWFFRN